LQRQNLAQYFDTILISDETGSAKPDPAIFHLALEKTRLKPEEAVHVGDSIDDVKGAKAAGIKPILIQRETTGQTADYKSESVEQHQQIWISEDLKTIRGLQELLDLF
jgi:FMN phosphatase YigB (HAD superfamily)